jgi:ABC-2 type transport system ATP-binding protein
MYPDLTVAENLDFFATIRGVPKQVRRQRAASLLAGMGLAEFAARQAQFLSGGMKQKLMLATTLMHEPDLLLLDEPTTGVDPVSRREFWRILADLHRAGRTVLVATPYMDEAERCTSVAFMDSGRMRHRGTPAEIKALIPGTLFEIAAPDPRAALAAINGIPGATSSHLFGDVVRVLWCDDADGAQQLRARLANAGVPVLDVRAAPIDLESAFAFLTEAGRP